MSADRAELSEGGLPPGHPHPLPLRPRRQRLHLDTADQAAPRRPSSATWGTISPTATRRRESRARRSSRWGSTACTR
ncbi:MAG: hypothetical protein MZW92_42885 [Comamonadaceae bacterium]|nr:hypothetical protein [Comamonadaceae bacterium]